MRFILGIIIGSLVTTLVFYSLTYKEYDHEQVKPDSTTIEEPQTESPSIVIFYNPSKREHKKLHKWLKRYNIQHKHQ